MVRYNVESTARRDTVVSFAKVMASDLLFSDVLVLRPESVLYALVRCDEIK